MRDAESVSSSTFSPFLVSCPESLRGAVAAAAQLPALDGARRLPARAAVRHLGQRLLRQRRATTASGLPSLGSGPREPRGFSWGAEDAQSQHQQLSRLILPSPLPGAAGFPCRSLPFPLLPLSPAGTDQVLVFFFPFPTGKIQQCQHLPRCSIAICRPEAVLKQQLHLLGRHRQAAKPPQFAIA